MPARAPRVPLTFSTTVPDCTNGHNSYEARPREAAVDYYIVADDSVVEGPFDTHQEARKRRADLSTSDVGVTYRIEKR